MKPFLLTLFFLTLLPSISSAEGWQNQWDIQDKFVIKKGAGGFEYPISIAVVPEPGSGPNAPLYFVTEIRGRIKVVTRGGEVHTFAEDVTNFTPEEELPSEKGEGGLTGVCLAPDQGFVFASFSYQDSKKIIRNGLVRFTSRSKVFSLKGDAPLYQKELFKNDEGAVSHMIGNCVVSGNTLFVGVGDGEKPYATKQVNNTLGKVLALNLDLKPSLANPFYSGNNHSPANAVWAYSFRNPFGIYVLNGDVFIAENGPSQDRLALIQKGHSGFWNGLDWHISNNALAVFSPTIGPVQLTYSRSSRTSWLPESYRNNFFIASSGSTGRENPSGIVRQPFDEKDKRAAGPAEYFLRYKGKHEQKIVGLGFGENVLYALALLPLTKEDNQTSVLEITYDKSKTLTANVSQMDGFELMMKNGCQGCHTIFGHGNSVGPPLDPIPLTQRIDKRLESADYIKKVAEVDSIGEPPYTDYKEARQEVLALKGVERIRAWVAYHIMEPKFDDPYSQMPNLQITKPDAEKIAEFLVPGYTVWDRILMKLRRFNLRLFPSLALIGLGLFLGLGVSHMRSREPKKERL